MFEFLNTKIYDNIYKEDCWNNATPEKVAELEANEKIPKEFVKKLELGYKKISLIR